jgi:hypothetical protein
LCQTDSESIRLYDWNTKPTRRRRASVRAGSRSRLISWPASSTCPLSGRSRPAAKCSRVDLPDPDGPITAQNVPAANATDAPSRARTEVPPE